MRANVARSGFLMVGQPRAGKKLNRGAKTAAYSRGDVMTGAGRVIRVDDIGRVLSSAGSRLAAASAAARPLSYSYRIYISRCAAPVFTVGMRGATPPPAD